MVLVALDIPAKAERAAGTAVGEAGFKVSGYQIVGINHMNRALVDAVVTDELRRAAAEAGSAKAPQALVSVSEIRQRLLGYGWVKDARVSRRLPDTLVIDIVERTPAALWQNQGRLALIDSEGVVLDRVPVDKMPDLPLLIGPGANGQEQQLDRPDGRGSDAQAAARFGQLGRWAPLGSRLPVGRDGRASRRRGNAAKAALVKFARVDKQSGLLGRGIVRFDLRVPGKMIVRLPRAPGEPIAAGRSSAAGGLVAQPVDRPLIAALDIGSSKVSAMIARTEEDGRLTVLGTGQRESRGVKRGFITDMNASEFAVREAVELAERDVGRDRRGRVGELRRQRPRQRPCQCRGRAWRPSRSSRPTSTSCSRPGKEAIDKNGQVVLHAHPALYTIDRAQGVQQPIGLHANRLGVDIHVIAAEPSPLRNIDTVIRQAHLGVRAIVASPVAAALACLSEEERELGVALVEMGAEVTNVSVHYGGMLVGLRSIELGARDITNDIAAAFAVQRRDAERLKCFYGSAMTSPRDNHEMIEATQIGAEPGAEPMKLTRAQLMMVIRQRVEELTNEIEAALKGLGFTGPVGRQVVLTGGGAELKNVADYMQGVLGRAVRVGRPKQITGLARCAQRPGILDACRARAARGQRPRRHSRHRRPGHAPADSARACSAV